MIHFASVLNLREDYFASGSLNGVRSENIGVGIPPVVAEAVADAWSEPSGPAAGGEAERYVGTQASCDVGHRLVAMFGIADSESARLQFVG